MQCMLQRELLPTSTLSVGVGRTFESVCLSVCLFVRSVTQKQMIHACRVFRRGIKNELEISYKWYGFGVERLKANVSVNSKWVLTLRVRSSL